MAELNDVEFGSDKGAVEAPILIAQRYLNIFRQIHIFGEETRNKFDEELLALPQNVSDYFKRMPGGRLLVEHIEDVKTAKGISFVKSNKDDFDNGANTAETTVASGMAVGGSVVIDSSFAETLATSMASAFQHIPVASASTSSLDASFADTLATALASAFKQTPPTVADSASGNNNNAVFENLNKTFLLIAEEIKNSHTSFLSALAETRKVTESLLSSQVALSTVLEKLCSANDGTQNIQQRVEAIASLKPVAPQLTTQNNTASVADVSQFSSDDVLEESVQPAYSEDDDLSQDFAQENSEQNFGHFAEVRGENVKKKKKKKKHNQNNQEFSNNLSPSSIDEVSGQQSGILSNIQKKLSDITLKSEKIAPAFSGVIRNIASKHDDDFKNVTLDEPPFESIDFEDEDTLVQSLDMSDSFVSTETIDDIDFSLPENSEEETIDTHTSLNESDSFIKGDGLDFALPEQSIGKEDEQQVEPDVVLQTLPNSDGLDFALPEQGIAVNNEEEENQLVLSGNDDGLDFSLPEIDETVSTAHDFEETSSTLSDVTVAQQDISTFQHLSEEVVSADLAYETDNELSQEDILTQTSDGLDEFLASDSSDFDLSGASVEASEEEVVSASADGLDEFLTSDSSDFDLSGASVETSDEEVVSAPADGLDEFVVRNETAVLQSNQDEEQFDSIIQPTKEEHPSRYSAELDKIRAALTSDNIDISSIDQPIALDDYSDDENVEEESSGEFTEQLNPSLSQALDNSVQETSVAQSDDEWEWEYVDENGNPIEGAEGDEEWEWEYVEDDGSTDEGNNK